MTLAIDKVDGCGLSNTVCRHADLACKEDKVDVVLAIVGRRINYLAVTTRQSDRVHECIAVQLKEGNRLQLHCNNLTFYYCLKSFINKALKLICMRCYAFFR